MEEQRIELMAQTSARAVLEHIWSFDADCQSMIIIFYVVLVVSTQ